MGLFDIFKKIPTANEMAGGFGEWLTKVYSKTMPGAMVIQDVLIDGADGYTSQIDVVIVGNRGVYVVEVKMYPDAKIYGDVRSSKWYYYRNGKKYEIYSPLKQNKKHVEYMKAFLKDFGDIPLFSVVTMICDDYKISGEFNKEGQFDTVVCTSLPAMDRGIKKIGDFNPIVWEDDKKKEIFEYIKNNQHKGKSARKEHKENVITYKENLDEMKEKKICPYCKTELVLREGKNGRFYGCKSFPKCRYTMSLENKIY